MPQITNNYEILSPQNELLVEEKPEAANAFPPNTVILKDKDKLTLNLRLTVSGKQALSMTPKSINVVNGEITEIVILNSDNRVIIDKNMGKKKKERKTKTILDYNINKYSYILLNHYLLKTSYSVDTLF